jgi:hypothetical protein
MSDEQDIQPKDDQLAAGLRRLGRPRMMVPQSVDDAILAAALFQALGGGWWNRMDLAKNY